MRPARVALAALVLVVAGACSGDDDPEVTGVTGPTTTLGRTTTSTTTARDTGSASTTDAHRPSTTAFAEAAATDSMNIRLKDFEFVDVPATVKGTRVVFKALNTGPSDHEVVVKSQGGDDVGHISPLARGDEGSMSLSLQPGTYSMQCLVETADGRTHLDLGMETTFVVTG